MGNKAVKPALFAYDLILFLSNPTKQLKVVLQTLSAFGELSGSTSPKVSNRKLESELAAPWPLMSLFHTGFSDLPQHLKRTITLRDTIVAWKEVRKAFLLSKHMPLWGHPEFSHNNNYDVYNIELRDKCVWLAKHVMHVEEKRWLSPQEVMDQYALPTKYHFKVMHILSLCRTRLRDLSKEARENPLTRCLIFPQEDMGYFEYMGLSKRGLRGHQQTQPLNLGKLSSKIGTAPRWF